jgi:protein tyrosine phosphatase
MSIKWRVGFRWAQSAAFAIFFMGQTTSTEQQIFRRTLYSKQIILLFKGRDKDKSLPELPEESLEPIAEDIPIAIPEPPKEIPKPKKKPQKLNLNFQKPQNPYFSPLSATTMNKAISLVQLSQSLESQSYLPAWLRQNLSNPNPVEIRNNLAKVFKTIVRLEQDRLMDNPAIYSTSIADSNRPLNRYTDIVPFDHNRVVLSDSYINASYLHALDGKTYITTQGPLVSTFGHFWQMVWEQNSSVIVMLTKIEESGRIKCHKYWPEPLGGVVTYGSFRIQFQDAIENIDKQVIIREFVLKNNDNLEIRTVKQLQFLGWPDHSTADPHLVLNLLDMANQEQINSVGPMIVHCSAGCGRTAAFCTIDSVLSSLSLTPASNPQHDELPPGDLIAIQANQFRMDRLGSIQTQNQFIFCYEAVLTRLFEWHSIGLPCKWSTKRFSLTAV